MVVNYPDVLGYITGGTRQNPGVVQAAAVTYPADVSAGQPFEIIILLQNTLATRVEVAVTINKKNWLALAQEQIKATLEPGETGMLTVGAKTHPKAPTGAQTLALDIQTQAADPKAAIIRPAEGGDPLVTASLPEARGKLIEGLRRMPFSAKKRGRLRVSGLELELVIRAASGAKPHKPCPGWRSLWSVADLDDLTPLAEQYGELVALRMLPKLTRSRLHEPVRAQMETLFKEMGYPLQTLETEAITRLMLLVLEYANAADNGHSSLQAGMYDIAGKMANGSANALPRWVETMLRTIARNPQAAQAPLKLIPNMAQDDLLYDAMMLGFRLIDDATGDPLGTPDEMQAYAEKLLNKFALRRKIAFGDVYMPLVIGGIIAYEYVLLPDEKLNAVLNEMKDLLLRREDEQDEDNELVFEVADQILTQSLRKYGSLDSRNL